MAWKRRGGKRHATPIRDTGSRSARMGFNSAVGTGIPFYFIIYSHMKYTLHLRVLGCSEDMGMSAHDAAASVDARIDTPVENVSD